MSAADVLESRVARIPTCEAAALDKQPHTRRNLPGEFVVGEEFGLSALGRWVLRSALAEGDLARRHPGIEVKIAAAQFLPAIAQVGATH